MERLAGAALVFACSIAGRAGEELFWLDEVAI
jgi:hypothetical protein